jgi:hypothetical protein
MKPGKGIGSANFTVKTERWNFGIIPSIKKDNPSSDGK